MTSVSVAMATCNGERYIRRQLESIARQSVPPTEVVITDDCSTDRTLEVVEEFARHAKLPVRAHRNSVHLGYRANFMQAAHLCRSELIAFCDQDDEWNERKLERCLEPFDDPTVLLCYHNAVVIDQAGNLIGDLSRYGSNEELFSVRRCQDFWFSSHGLTQVVRAHLVRFSDLRALTIDHRSLTGEPLAHDQWFFFLATSLGRIRYLPECLVRYRQHDQNVVGFQRFSFVKSNFIHALTMGFEQYDRIEKDALRRAQVLNQIGVRCEGAERKRAVSAAEQHCRLAVMYGKRKQVFAQSKLGTRVRSWACLVSMGGYVGRATYSFGLISLVKDVMYGIVLRRFVGGWPFRTSRCGPDHHVVLGSGNEARWALPQCEDADPSTRPARGGDR
jgi:rhamnosyltransferase